MCPDAGGGSRPILSTSSVKWQIGASEVCGSRLAGAPQHFLYFLPDPHRQGALRWIFTIRSAPSQQMYNGRGDLANTVGRSRTTAGPCVGGGSIYSLCLAATPPSQLPFRADAYGSPREQPPTPISDRVAGCRPHRATACHRACSPGASVEKIKLAQVRTTSRTSLNRRAARANLDCPSPPRPRRGLRDPQEAAGWRPRRARYC